MASSHRRDRINRTGPPSPGGPARHDFSPLTTKQLELNTAPVAVPNSACSRLGEHARSSRHYDMRAFRVLDLPAEPPTQIFLHSNCFSSPTFDSGTGGERTEILLAVSIVSAYSPSNCHRCMECLDIRVVQL